MIITVGKGGLVPLETFASFLDVSKIGYYSLKANKNKTLTLKFYDKKKKLIKIILDKKG